MKSIAKTIAAVALTSACAQQPPQAPVQDYNLITGLTDADRDMLLKRFKKANKNGDTLETLTLARCTDTQTGQTQTEAWEGPTLIDLRSGTTTVSNMEVGNKQALQGYFNKCSVESIILLENAKGKPAVTASRQEIKTTCLGQGQKTEFETRGGFSFDTTDMRKIVYESTDMPETVITNMPGTDVTVCITRPEKEIYQNLSAGKASIGQWRK